LGSINDRSYAVRRLKRRPELIERTFTEAREYAQPRDKTGRPTNVGITNILPSPSKGGSTRAYILARLDRDGHTELAAMVEHRSQGTRTDLLRSNPTKLNDRGAAYLLRRLARGPREVLVSAGHQRLSSLISGQCIVARFLGGL
jgi:hypothetical protein